MEKGFILQRTLYILILGLVFLIPLWFLPVTQDFLDFQKQALMVFLVSLAVLIWFIKTIRSEKLQVRRSWVYLPVISFVFVVLISALFSIWQYASFWGWPLNISDSFVSILFFAILSFLIINSLENEKQFFLTIITFVLVLAVSVLYSLLQSYQIFSVPFPFFELSTFNTIGSMNSVAVLSAVFFPLSFLSIFYVRGITKWILCFSSLIFLLAVLLVNFFYAWIALAAGLIALVFFGAFRIKDKYTIQWIYFPVVLLVVSAVFLVFRFSIPGSPSLAPENSPSGSTEMAILAGALQHNAVFGTGPSTFSLDYSKYHSASLNTSVFWGATFSSGASAIIDTFITTGIGGILFLVILMGVIVFCVRAVLSAKSNDPYWFLKLGLLASLISITLAQVFYYANFVISFALWLLLACVVGVIFREKKIIAMPKKSKQFVFYFSLFLLIFVFGAGLLFIGGQNYIAEIRYFNGLKKISHGQENDGVLDMISAAKLNPSMDIYWRDLAQFYVASITNINANTSLSDADRKSKSQNAVSNAVFAANQSVKVAPANVENWNVRGYVYRNLIGIENAADLAVESYTTSVQLQPASPFAWTELARVYLLKAQYLAGQNKDTAGQQDALQKSLEDSQESIKLDIDYAPAYYLVALVYDQQGKSDEAIQNLEASQNKAPKDISLAFQIGMIYYQKNQIDQAKTQFEKAKNLDPNYSNARYMLGLVYEKQGDLQSAIGEFEALQKLNPSDSGVQSILDNLKQGKPSYGNLP